MRKEDCTNALDLLFWLYLPSSSSPSSACTPVIARLSVLDQMDQLRSDKQQQQPRVQPRA